MTPCYYCRIFAIDGEPWIRPVTFKVSKNIQKNMKLTGFNQTERDIQIWRDMRLKGVYSCKTFDIVLNSEVDPQETLDIMLTFVESTIQRSNSGTNCLNKNITMKELLAVVKLLYHFELVDFEEDLLQNIIQQKISKSNCLYALYESFLKVQEAEAKDQCKYWYILLSFMIDYWVFHFRYLLKWQKDLILEFTEISTHIVEVIITKSLVFFFPDPYYDNTDIIEFLMELKEFDNIFEFFEQEKRDTLNIENSRADDETIIKQCFSWELIKFKGNLYKETVPFTAEEWFWSISLSYIKDEEDFLNVSIRMVNNPYEERRKAYYKKEEYYYQIPEDYNIGVTGKPQREVKYTGMAQHALSYISGDIKLDDEADFNNIKIFPLICSSKMPTLIAKIPKSMIDQRNDTFNIFFYIKIKPTLSAILTYISRNFDLLHDDPKISLLSKDDIYTLLRHKDLSVGHEDQVLKAMCIWRSARPINFEYQKIFNWINWNYCSLESILRMLYKYKAIREDKAVKNWVQLEFLRRCKKSQEDGNANSHSKVDKNAPRLRYKYIGGIKSTLSNGDENGYSDILPFLKEDNSKSFVEKMFETLINIMKTAKITQQYDEIITWKSQQNNSRSGEDKSPKEEWKETPGNYLRNSDNNSVSEESFESESEESVGLNQDISNTLRKQGFFKQLQQPGLDLNELLIKYKLQKEAKLRERAILEEKLNNFDINDARGNNLQNSIRNEEENYSQSLQKPNHRYQNPKEEYEYSEKELVKVRSNQKEWDEESKEDFVKDWYEDSPEISIRSDKISKQSRKYIYTILEILKDKK